MELPLITSPLTSLQEKKSTTDIRKDLATGKISTLQDLRIKVFSRYVDHFRELSKPLFTPRVFGPTSHRDETVWNSNASAVNRVLTDSFSSITELNGSILAHNNLMTQSADDITATANSLQDKLTSLQNTIETRQFFDKGKSVVIIEDSFTDNKLINFSKTSGVDVDLSISAVSLSTSSNVSRSPAVIDIQISTNKDVDQDSTLYAEDGLPKKPRSYEGNRFDFLGQARPQSGAWRIESKNTKVDKASPDIEREEYYANLNQNVFAGGDEIVEETGTGFEVVNIGASRVTPSDFIFDDRAVATNDINWIENGTDAFANTITREDFIYIETLPTDAQLQTSRFSMFDGDPNSLWEIEYTPVVPGLDPSSIHNTLAPVAVSNGTPLSGETASSSYAQYQTLTSSYFSASSAESLEITITVTLDDSYVLNYIDLFPFFFSSPDEANFEVTRIVTQEDETSPQLSIPGFDTEFDNIIGRSSNSSLSNKQLEDSGIFNRFSYRAKGFWSFSKRKVKIITMTIRQDTALPNPYQLKMVQLLKKSSMTLSQSKSAGTTSSSGFGSTSSDKSGSGNILERGRVTQLVQFGYLETVLANLEASNTGLLAGTSSGADISLNSSTGGDTRFAQGTGGLFSAVSGAILPSVTGAANASIGAPTGTGVVTAGPNNAVATGLIAAATVAAGAVLDSLFTKSGGSQSSSTNSKSYNDSGFQINKEFTRTLWSRGRYAIGIRDIGLYSKTYTDLGVLFSSDFPVLAGDKILTLEIDNKIPLTYVNFNETTAWIEYYIVINGKEIRMKPIKIAPPELPHIDFPDTINLSEFGDSTELISVSFKAVVKRPGEETLRNAESETPLLKSYKIIIESV